MSGRTGKKYQLLVFLNFYYQPAMKNNDKKIKRDLKHLPPRIVIKFKKGLNLPYKTDEEILNYFKKNNIIPLKKLLEKFPGIVIRKLYTSLSPAKINKLVSNIQKLNIKYSPSEFLACFAIDCPDNTNTDELLSLLLGYPNVEDAYIECDAVPPECIFTGTNPDRRFQGYLKPAPEGINARYAWTIDGGCGNTNVKLIDIELGWILNHEDLAASGSKILWGNEDPAFKYHGSAVLGIILMQDNNLGGLGITPEIKANVIAQLNSTGRNAINDAILKAIDCLDAGDILLLEAQYTERTPPHKHWPVEVRPVTFDVIELATAKGIIVIEAAGNGSFFDNIGNNLDEYTRRNNKRILDRTSRDFKDSGAIVVAAASNSDAHGKMRSSNYGNRIDCFAWGTGVYTTGDTRTSYETNFNGTSSASAIIAGAALAVQSIMEASGQPRLTPAQMRTFLSDEQNGTSSRNIIGVMPDLKKIIQKALPRL